MSTLNSLFDVQFGWAGAHNDFSTITVPFTPNAAVIASNQLLEGEFVSLGADNTVNRATGANYGGAGSVAALAALIAESKQMWMIVGGAGPLDYDSHIQTGAPVNGVMTYVSATISAIRGTFVVRTTEFVTRAYAKGNSLTVINGELDVTIAGTNVGYQPVGEVHDYDATTGTLDASIST